MAVETTTFTPKLIKFGFEGISDAASDTTAVPRQELFYTQSGENILSPPAGDSQSVELTFRLPFGFAYVITDVNFSIFGADAGDWSGQANGYIANDTPAQADIIAHFGGWTFGSPVGDGGLVFRTYSFQELPSWVFIPQSNDGALVRFITSSNQIDGGTVGLQFVARFLQYDVSQAHHFAVNTPIPTR